MAFRPAWLPSSIGFSLARVAYQRDDPVGPVDAQMDVWRAHLPHDLRAAAAKRRAEFLTGRLCAMAAADAISISLPTVSRGAAGDPIWPSGLTGSISHTDALACAVVAKRRHHHSIGIDIETLGSAMDADHLAPMIFAPGEAECLQIWQPDGATRFTMAFAAKEAVYKCLYPHVRRFIDFDEVQLRPCSQTTLCAVMAPALAAQANHVHLHVSTDIVEGNVLALCEAEAARTPPKVALT